MSIKLFLAFTATAVLTLTTSLMAEDVESGFVSLCDGKTFNGWKSSTDHPDTWKIEDGAFVTRGQTAHLFYVGDLAPFTNFDLKVDVMTDPGDGVWLDTVTAEGKFKSTGKAHNWKANYHDVRAMLKFIEAFRGAPAELKQ